MNDTEIAGPVMLPAVDAVTVKMPAPTTTETPKTVRSHQVRSLRSRVLGSSVSAIDCSTDLVRLLGHLVTFRPGRSRQGTHYDGVDGSDGQHAVVIGASIAGLCAARVLADFYDTVSVFDRDDLPDGPRTARPSRRTATCTY